MPPVYLAGGGPWVLLWMGGSIWNGAQQPMTRPSKSFPPSVPYPVMPPDDYWLLRWHWLKDTTGDTRCVNWSHLFGWHLGHGGRLDPDEMAGWEYVAPAVPPMI